MASSVLFCDGSLYDELERQFYCHAQWHVACWHLANELECGFGVAEKQGNFQWSGRVFRGPCVPDVLPNEVQRLSMDDLEALECWSIFPERERARVARWVKMSDYIQPWQLDLRYWDIEHRFRIHFRGTAWTLRDKGYEWDSQRCPANRMYDDDTAADWDPALKRFVPRKVYENPVAPTTIVTPRRAKTCDW